MRWENIKSFFGFDRTPIRDKVVEIVPRPLSDREASWIRRIAEVNPDWREANFSKTMVVAEGPNSEGFSIVLQAPEPESPRLRSRQSMVGQLWIQTDDPLTINVQLSHFNGNLKEIYILCIDSRGRDQTLPEHLNEVSWEAVNC